MLKILTFNVLALELKHSYRLCALSSPILDMFFLTHLEQVVYLTSEVIAIQHMKERIQFGVLMNNYQISKNRMALDRIVPLPGFNFEQHPYVLVNKADVMDLSTGDLVSKISYGVGGFASSRHEALGSITGTQILMTYGTVGNDEVLGLWGVARKRNNSGKVETKMN